MLTKLRQTGLLSSALLPLGLLYLIFNLGYSFAFYHVNSYKLLVGLLGALVLVAWFEGRRDKNAPLASPKGLFVVLALPVLVTLPGALVGGFAENYNFAYELGTGLILWLWGYYAFRAMTGTQGLGDWSAWLGLSLLWVGLWALGQGVGILDSPNLLAGEVKASFGHRNYFASYLIQMLPLFLVLGLPGEGESWADRGRWWFAGLFVLAVLSLWLTQSRAAIVTFGLVALLLVLGFILRLTPKRLKTKLLLLLLGLALLGGTAAATYVARLTPDPVYGSRFEQLFSKRAWIGRIIPWQAATEAILAAPVLGHGLGSSYNLFFTYVDPQTRLYHPERSYNHAHSEPLEFLEEAGLLGLLAYGLMLFWLGRAFWRCLEGGRDQGTKKLALGLGGGLLAFVLHGTVEVAPRMLVAELPFALGAAALLALEAQVVGFSPPSARQAKALPWTNLALWGLAAFLLLPWLVKQNAYYQVLNLPETPGKAQEMEELAKSSNDIYTLDDLLHLEAKLGRLEQMKQMIDRLEALVPNYRDLNYQKAVWASLTGDLGLAKQLALEGQKRDRYYLPNLRLLMSLALESNDYEGFVTQFGLTTRFLLFQNFVIIAFEEESAPILLRPTSFGVELAQSPEGIRIQFDPLWLRQFFDQARALRSAPPGPMERSELMNRIARQVSSNPFFRIEIKEPYLIDEPQIYLLLDRYKTLNQELAQQEDYLRFSLNKDLEQAGPQDRGRIERQYQEKFRQAQADTQAQTRKLEAQLEEKTRFRHFLNKHRFAAAWLSEIQQLYFP